MKKHPTVFSGDSGGTVVAETEKESLRAATTQVMDDFAGGEEEVLC